MAPPFHKDMNGRAAFCIDSSGVKIVKWKKRFSCCAAILGMIVLLLDSETAASGVRDGISLCLRTVIPSLFLLLILSSVLVSSGDTAIFPHRLRNTFGIPEGVEALLIPGFLGGYPVGAQAVYQKYRCGAITKPLAERLLAFCSNAGPAFIFGMAGRMFPEKWMAWALWGIHVAGAGMASYLIDWNAMPCSAPTTVAAYSSPIIPRCVATMGTICGWIVLFRAGISYLDQWILHKLPEIMRVSLIGMLEISNGCCELARISNTSFRFVLCSGMLAAGGLCVTMQTASVTKEMSLRWYGVGKAIQLITSVLLSLGIMYRTIYPVLPLFILILLKKAQNGVAFPGKLMYNTPESTLED